MDGEEEVVVRKRRRSARLSKKDRQRMNNYFTEYCDATSIHGFRYLGEQKRSCVEKLWWLITIVVSVFILAILITETYKKWDRSPVIVSFATKQTPIWQIPFPAVTICPETKSRQSVFNFTRLYSKNFSTLTKQEKIQFVYSSLICNARGTMSQLKERTLDEKVLDFYDEVSPSFHNVSLKCTWMRQTFKCESLFTPIMTDVGICYTFNMLKWEELFKPDVKMFKNYLQHNSSSGGWSLEKGYAPDEKKETYPRRALYAGATNGLKITMVSYEKDLDYICGDSLQGFKVLLHHPAEMPRVSQQYFRLPLDQTVVAAIKPDMMTTSEELRGYKPNKRQCFFPNERKLRFFAVYTQQNCEIECLANFTLHTCKCVDFHMPRVNGTPICGPANKRCMKGAESILLSREIDQKLKEMEEAALEDTNVTLEAAFGNIYKGIQNLKFPEKKKAVPVVSKKNCDCLQACTSLSYSTETSQSDWDWVQSMRGLNDPYGFVAENYVEGRKLAYLSKLVLFFKDMQFIASERNELYGLTDFLANCGGLLGLFTGFSVISLVEVIYFLTLRWMCNIRLMGKKHWSGAKD